jgi:hypothetical protein
MGARLLHPVAVLLFYAALFALFFGPVLFSERLFSSDGLLPAFYAPIQPWTSLLFSGYPLLAAPEWQALYPLRWLFGLLPDGLNFNLYVTSAYVLAASFTYGYVYALTGSRFAALVSGTIFSLSGFMLVHLSHTSMIHAAVWLPLMLWALERLHGGVSWPWFAIGASAIALGMLAGHPQILAYTLLLSLGYPLLLGRTAAGGPWRYGGQYLGLIALGLGLAAAQWLPTLELIEQSIRSRLTFEAFVSFSLPPAQIIQLFFPYVFDVHPPLPAFSSVYQPTYFGAWNLYEITGYVGWLTMGLATVGVIAHRRKTRVAFWLVVAILAFLLALGDATPLAGLMYQVPVINQFRVQGRHFLEMTLAFGVLAGYGVAALGSAAVSERDLQRVALAGMGLLLALLLGISLNYGELCALAQGRGVALPGFFQNGAVWMPVIVAIVAAAGLWYGRTLRQSVAGCGLLLLILAFDLGSFGWFQDWHRYALDPAWIAPSADTARWAARLAHSHQRLAPLAGSNSALFAPNGSQRHGIASVSGYGPLVLERYYRFLGIEPSGHIVPAALEPEHHALDLLAARYILPPGGTVPLPEGRWRWVETMAGQPIYENQRAMPRVWLVPEVIKLPPPVILQVVQGARLPDGRRFEPGRMALVEEPVALAAAEPEGASHAMITHLSDTRMEISASSATPVFMVLSDLFYPGWRATVDGVAIPLVRTNYVLRGLSLPAGSHTVRVEFRSVSQRVGGLITLLSVGILLAGLMQGARTFRRRPAHLLSTVED